MTDRASSEAVTWRVPTLENRTEPTDAASDASVLVNVTTGVASRLSPCALSPVTEKGTLAPATAVVGWPFSPRAVMGDV